MSDKITRGQAIWGMLWLFFERCGNQGVHFVVSVILARILEPAVYGTIAIIDVFTFLFSTFINSGFSSALIQKKDADDLDYSSVFFFNIAMGLFIYVIMFFCAPWIANFYSEQALSSYIRVYCLMLILGSLKSVQSVYVKKHYLFQRFFFSTLGGSIAAAILGIWMAYHGYGPWALIWQAILNLVISTAVLWLTVKWHPKFMFSFSRLRKLFDYGWKMLISNLLDSWYNKLRTILIGKFYSREDLAFYNKGHVLPSMMVTNINGSINGVLFPSMSALQNDKEQLKAYMRRAIRLSTFLIMPGMVLLASSADSVITLLLTEKWLPCVFYLRVACFTYAFYPLHTANLCAIQAMGRSDIFLRLEIIKKVVALGLLFSTLWISVKALALSAILGSISSQLVNSYPNRKLLGYAYWDQLKDIFPQISLSCFMGICVYLINFLHWNVWVTLSCQIAVGIFVYISLAFLFKVESFYYVLSFVKRFHQRRKG